MSFLPRCNKQRLGGQDAFRSVQQVDGGPELVFSFLGDDGREECEIIGTIDLVSYPSRKRVYKKTKLLACSCNRTATATHVVFSVSFCHLLLVLLSSESENINVFRSVSKV